MITSVSRSAPIRQNAGHGDTGVKIRSRAPLRLGLAGGGTDVSPYCDDYGGAVLNATINRYAYAFIEPSRENRIRFIASDLHVDEAYSLEFSPEQPALKLHSAVYSRMIREFGEGRPIPITVQTSVEAPPGSGLGSSSALVVALVEAFRSFLSVPLGPYEIAHLAYDIERIDLGLAGGKQDQYAAVFGGVNYIEFLAEDRVVVNPLRLPRMAMNEFQLSIVVCFSGISRRSEQIIEQQRRGLLNKSSRTIDNLHQLKSDALEMKLAFLRADVSAMARILDRSWKAKKQLAAAISTKQTDLLYEVAMNAGALAGKVSGAGGGGFIMFFVPPERRLNVIRALNESGGVAETVQFTTDGAESWTASSEIF
jgi:D-glycero-alpha-D-manno-heptose-7-phosphate kinase